LRLSGVYKIRGSNPGGARLSAPVQTVPYMHTPPKTICTGYLTGVQSRGVGLATQHHVALRLKNEYSYTSIKTWAFVACYRVNIKHSSLNLTAILTVHS
jgi:hypothetical protein